MHQCALAACLISLAASLPAHADKRPHGPLAAYDTTGRYVGRLLVNGELSGYVLMDRSTGVVAEGQIAVRVEVFWDERSADTFGKIRPHPGFVHDSTVYFTSPGCAGQAYINPWPYLGATQSSAIVTTGGRKILYVASTAGGVLHFYSQYRSGECANVESRLFGAPVEASFDLTNGFPEPWTVR